MTHFTIPERCEYILFCLSADNKSNEPKQNQFHTFRKNQRSYVMGNSKDKNKGRRTSLNTSKSKKSLGKWLTGTFQTFLAEIFELLFLGSRKCPSTQISSKGIIFDNKHDELKILQKFENGSFQTFFQKSVFLNTPIIGFWGLRNTTPMVILHFNHEKRTLFQYYVIETIT